MGFVLLLNSYRNLKAAVSSKLLYLPLHCSSCIPFPIASFCCSISPALWPDEIAKSWESYWFLLMPVNSGDSRMALCLKEPTWGSTTTVSHSSWSPAEQQSEKQQIWLLQEGIWKSWCCLFEAYIISCSPALSEAFLSEHLWLQLKAVITRKTPVFSIPGIPGTEISKLMVFRKPLEIQRVIMK